LKAAVSELRRDETITVEPRIDQGAAGAAGSANIADTILAKIAESFAVVADVSIVSSGAAGRATPNPNVLLEVGYAWAKLGFSRVIPVANVAFGAPEVLPFDLRGRHIVTYNLPDEGDRQRAKALLVSKLKHALADVVAHSTDTAESEQKTQLVSALGGILVEVLAFCDLHEELWQRNDEVRSHLSHAADRLRQIGIDSIGVGDFATADELGALAARIDEYVDTPVFLSGGADRGAILRDVSAQAARLKAKYVDLHRPSDESVGDVDRFIADSHRRLSVERGRLDPAGRTPPRVFREVVSESNRLGLQLLKLGYYDLEQVRPGLGALLQRVGAVLYGLTLSNQMPHTEEYVAEPLGTCIDELSKASAPREGRLLREG
jgi:hypothetical protein